MQLERGINEVTLLAVDIGNTSTTIGMFDHADPSNALSHRFDIPTRTLTHRALTRETLDVPLAGIPTPNIIGIASVVPWASDELIVVLHEIFPETIILVITSSNMPMKIDYPHPEELGTDRLLGALAAFKLWGERERRPCIVVDLGTATTYDCVTADGTFLGGAIAPGLELGAEALTQRTAQLPSIELSFPSSIIGRTTVESIQSGILYGGLAQLEGFVERLRQFAFPNEEPIVIATGGLSRLIEGKTQRVSQIDPALVLEGIRIASELIAEQTMQGTSAEESV
ncbi:MAG TPA: type III pantothenate kinase, partial [Candidatus Kapabacteria bacterium]|nr:type III pantothenate kinase [Candidatus Kapabacteria bacterium]